MRIEEMVTFVHELGHAIKGHEKEFELQNNEKGEQILVERSGLAYNTYKVTLQKGMVVLELLNEKNLGLEEGINTLDEEEIINNILFRKEQDTHMLPENCRDYLEKVKTKGEKEPYKVTGYVLQKVFSERIMYDLGLKKTIRKDQLEGRNTIEVKYNERFIDGENHWRRLNSEMDYATRLSYDKFANIFNLEEWIRENGEEEKRNIESIKEEIQQYAKTVTAEEILEEKADEQKD